MFNVRIKRFYDSEQIQIYSKFLHSDGEVVRRKVDERTGEIFPTERKQKEILGEWMETPFSDDEDNLEYLYDMDSVFEEKANNERSVSVSRSRSIHKIYDIARSNKWDWFFTFTFDGKKVNRYDYDDCGKRFSMWLNRMRKKCPDMTYIVVPEQHKDGAFHFHGLFSNVDGLDFVFSGKSDDQGRPIYNIGNYRFGFTTATKITDYQKASSYLCKYITKDLCSVTFGKKRYWSSRNCNKPVIEDYLYEGKILECMKLFTDGSESYVKQVHSEYVDVIYIDRQIYSKNMCFANRWM